VPLDACKVDVGFLIFKLPATSSGWSPGVRPEKPFSVCPACGGNAADTGRRALKRGSTAYCCQGPMAGVLALPGIKQSSGAATDFRLNDGSIGVF